MPDAVERQPPLIFLDTQRIGNAQVGMPHHAENLLHTPVGHGLHHQVAYGTDVALFRWQSDIDAVSPFFNGEGLTPSSKPGALPVTGS